MAGLGGRFPVLNADEGQAHLPILPDVGVVDLGDEFQSGRPKWIIPGEINLQMEGLEVIGRLVLVKEKRLSSVLMVQLPKKMAFLQGLSLIWFPPFLIPGSQVFSVLLPGRYEHLAIALEINRRIDSHKSAGLPIRKILALDFTLLL